MPSIPGGAGGASSGVPTSRTIAGNALSSDISADTLRSSLAARTIDPLSGSGWTVATLSGTATAAWVTGPARLSLSVPASTDGACSAVRSGYIPESEDWDVLARVQITAGDGAANTRLIIQAGIDTDNLYALALYADGTLEPGRIVATVYTGSGTAAGPDSGQRTGGQLWLRISRRTVGVAAYWGVGSAGAVPTSWTLVAVPDTAVAALNVTNGTYVSVVHLAFGGGVAGGFAADVLSYRLRGVTGVTL